MTLDVSSPSDSTTIACRRISSAFLARSSLSDAQRHVDGVVERGRSVDARRANRTLERTHVIGEWLRHAHLAVELDDLDDVVLLHSPHESDGGLLRRRELVLHAVAGIEQDCQRDRLLQGGEEAKRLLGAVLVDLEIVLLSPVTYFAPSVTVTFSETSSMPDRNRPCCAATPIVAAHAIDRAATTRPWSSLSRYLGAGPHGDARARDRDLEFLGWNQPLRASIGHDDIDCSGRQPRAAALQGCRSGEHLIAPAAGPFRSLGNHHVQVAPSHPPSMELGMPIDRHVERGAARRRAPSAPSRIGRLLNSTHPSSWPR